MSQERWDVILSFRQGPLSFQGETVCRGPVVRMGVNPGPGGVVLDGYRGLDDRQAVITAYDGGRVALAPVGSNQVRVAPHGNVDWAEVQCIRGPVYLSPGDAFHLGPPERGVSALFVEARRLGSWEAQQILSEAASADLSLEPTEVKSLDTRKGIPVWFIPGVLVVGLATAVLVFLSQVKEIEREVDPLGPRYEGEESFERVDLDVEVDDEVLEGLRGPFLDFVMRPNARLANDESLEEPENWDQKFFDMVSRSVVAHAESKRFWARLERVKDEYAFVVEELEQAELPEIFAAIPYHESQYRSSNQSPACAEGYWQFQPEVARRMKLGVGKCTYRSGYKGSYTPTRTVPPKGVLENAEYIDSSNGTYRCKIKTGGCQPDDRRDLELSTAAALEMLEEAFQDELLAESGVAVQGTILSHNTGYWDERYDQASGPRKWNVRPALERFIDLFPDTSPSNFYGNSITCIGEQYAGIENSNKTCESVLLNQPQQYAYSVVAVHFLAVCYYGKNYGNEDPFRDWRRRYEDEYCSKIAVPGQDEATKWAGG